MVENEQLVDFLSVEHEIVAPQIPQPDASLQVDDSRQHFKMHCQKLMYKLLGRIEIC